MFSTAKKYIILHPGNSLLLLLNLVFFTIIAVLYVMLNNKPQAPQALIAPHITMGKITLKVGNIQAMENFYFQLLGMEILSKNNSSVTLGYNKQEVLQLINTPNLPMPSAGDPGLDQIAIVFNSRPGLARVLQRILNTNPGLYAGGTGRGPIGEAFYVVDPQGNSLELYYDTDPSTWPRSARGNVEGDALPIDITQYIEQYASKSGDNGMKLGHLQMRIGDMTQGKDFYLNIIGFYAIPQLLGNTNQSLFMSDGYYHHDLVINQAQGYDGDPITQYQGLYGFSFSVPSNVYLEKLQQRLMQAHVSYKKDKDSVTFSDPWGINITVSSQRNWWEQLL